MDVRKIRNKEQIEAIEFVSEIALKCKSPEEIPGFKWLRQYPGFARIEIAPFRIGVEVSGDTIILKRVLSRLFFYSQFP